MSDSVVVRDIVAVQWNMNDGGIADKKEDWKAIVESVRENSARGLPDLTFFNEGSDQSPFFKWLRDRHPKLKLLRGRKSGQPAIAVALFKPRFKVRHLIEIDLPDIPGEKKKWAYGAQVVDEISHNMMLNVLASHMYSRQNEGNRGNVVDQSLRKIRSWADDGSVPTLLVMDANRKPSDTKRELGPDWSGNQMVLKPVTTFGDGWEPDQGWLRDPHDELKWVEHWVVKGLKDRGNQHHPLIMKLRPSR